jgi:Glu-tRNA(Gln) amidotransferase subunit E-like FAD-binding protein
MKSTDLDFADQLRTALTENSESALADVLAAYDISKDEFRELTSEVAQVFFDTFVQILKDNSLVVAEPQPTMAEVYADIEKKRKQAFKHSQESYNNYVATNRTGNFKKEQWKHSNV